MLRTILGIIGIILVGAILYYFFIIRDGQMGPRVKETTPLNIDLQEIKPEEWHAIEKEGLLKISIDGDSAVEWLFLYRDTGDTNQIGGLIYDAQNRPKGVTSMAASQQSPAYLIPYRLMPDYTANKSAGYLGDASVRYKTVTVATNHHADNRPEESGVMVGNRLLVSGFDNNRPNRFSVFWWIGPQEGYGGALAYTPGWFSLSKNAPNDWFDWARGNNQTEHAETIYAWEPQVDRSNICRRVMWRLEGAQDQNTLQFVADYINSDLTFCRGGVPTEPAFPEAQVLAYLLDENPDHRKQRLSAGAALPSYNNVSVRKINQPTITIDATMVDVITEFTIDDVFHHMLWRVEMIPPEDLKSSVHWRIVSAYEQ